MENSELIEFSSEDDSEQEIKRISWLQKDSWTPFEIF